VIKIKNYICIECKTEFSINELTGKYTLRKANQVCCPLCQYPVIDKALKCEKR